MLIALLLGGLVGGVILAVNFLRMPEDSYVIETDDPNYVFHVTAGGGVALEDRSTERKSTLKVLSRNKDSGELELDVGDVDLGLPLKTKIFTIKRGDKAALKSLIDEEAWWLKKVQAMPAEKQVDTVIAELRRRNPQYDGQKSFKIRYDKVAELQFLTDNVTDISPVRALTGLQSFSCSGSHPKQGQLVELSALKDLKLNFLDCSNTRVKDLSPLKDMKLETLMCNNTPVEDLSPLRHVLTSDLQIIGAPVTDLSPLEDTQLRRLAMSGTRVSDLSPLKNLKLIDISLSDTPVSDLSALSGMKLQFLRCHHTGVKNLWPLKGMNLTLLECGSTGITDLSPLSGMDLNILHCAGAKVIDLSPLKGMSLREIVCDFNKERDSEILRGISTLERINHTPVIRFWKEVDGEK